MNFSITANENLLEALRRTAFAEPCYVELRSGTLPLECEHPDAGDLIMFAPIAAEMSMTMTSGEVVYFRVRSKGAVTLQGLVARTGHHSRYGEATMHLDVDQRLGRPPNEVWYEKGQRVKIPKFNFVLGPP